MKEFFENQYKNLFLWVPFVVAFGAALYFGLNTEPNFHFPILITILLGIIIYKNKNVFLRAIALCLFGFFYAMSFTHIIDTPQVSDSFGAIPISGEIRDIDYTTDKTRLIIRVPSDQIKSETNKKFIKLRITLSEDTQNINIGDTISGNAVLFHPSAKYAPASFDYARWAYFEKISATGFFENYEIIKSNTNPNIRTYIHNKSDSFLTDSLVLGFKKTIPDFDSNIWKSVGIGHVWSISGFHMTLVGGWLFALFYLIFRLSPKITKRVPAKFPAIICAWIGLLFYVCLSGISVATIRAFLMTTLIFAAILLGRSVLSLRNAALAFLIIFLINPFYAMSAGFQLSFAAIFGLLWFFDDQEYVKRNFIKRHLHILYMAFLTAIIATIFTMPFIIAHFGYIPIYSLIGNLILLPIFSILIMPLVIIGTICALFNYHMLINAAHDIYNFSLSLATNISEMPYANIQMPHISNSVLILCIIGLLCLILIVKTDSKNLFIKNINYILCSLCIMAAVLINISTPRPLFYATEDHQLVGFVVNDKLQFNHAKMSKHYFAFSSWYEFNNETQPDKNTRYKCTHGLCRYDTKQWNLVYMQNFTALMNNIENVCEDKSVDYVVTTFDVRTQNCHAKILNYGLIIYPNGKFTKIINLRPWHNQH
jgi:competence protein ComEC